MSLTAVTQRQYPLLKRSTICRALALAVIAAAALPEHAWSLEGEARIQSRTWLEFHGQMRTINMFRGKAGSKDGLQSDVAVRGAVQVTANGKQREAIDLDSGLRYSYRDKGRRCKATSLDEFRESIEQLQEMTRGGGGGGGGAPGNGGDAPPEYDFRFDIKRTGTTETVGGLTGEVHETTFEAFEKGKPDAVMARMSGRSVMVPHTPETRRAHAVMADWTRAYMEAVGMAGIAQGLAQVFAQSPVLSDMNERLRDEFGELDSFAVRTENTFSIAAPPAAAATDTASAEAPAAAADSEEAPRRGLRGAFGGLREGIGGLRDRATRAAKREGEKQVEEAAEREMQKRRQAGAQDAAANGGLNRIYTTRNEVLLIAADAGDLVNIPAACRK